VITVDRIGLPNGRLGARITVAPTSGSPIIVPVTLQVGFASGVGDAGRLYVLLMDPQLNVVAQTVTDAANGAYAYSFPNVTPGTYFVAAGSDADNDGEVCDAGEACGQYPTLGSPSEVIVTETRSGIDFPVSFRSELTTTIGTSPSVTKPLRRVAPPKTLGAR
jgi:serine protease